MHRGLKRRITGWSTVVCAVLMAVTPAWADDAPSRATYQSAADRPGDVVDGESDPLDDARGDILQAAAQYTAESLQFEVRVARFTDPVKDPNWVSDSTYVGWTLDTNRDAKGDFMVEYGIVDGELYGAVFRGSASDDDAADDAPAICAAQSVLVGPDGVYGVHLDPACIGRPDSVAWSVEFSYDTNPKVDNAPATEDLLPDKGFSAPVFAPPGAPAPSPGATAAPSEATPSPAAASGGATDPSAAIAQDAPKATPVAPPGSDSGSSARTVAPGAAKGASDTPAEEGAGSSVTVGQPTGAATPAPAGDELAGAARGSQPGSRTPLILLAALLPVAVFGALFRLVRARALSRSEQPAG